MNSTNISFRVPQDDFRYSIDWVMKPLQSKPTQPILRGILIEADAEGLTISGFDQEVSTKIRLNADVLTEGTILIPGQLAKQIVDRLPNRPIDVHAEDSKIIFASGSARFEVPPMTLEDYPTRPEVPQVTGSIDAKVLKGAVSQVSKAAARDSAVPVLTGIQCEIEGEDIRMIATDRFRLAVRKLTWVPAQADISTKLLIPAKTLSDVAQSFAAVPSSDPVEFAAGTGEDIGATGLLGLQTEDQVTTTRLLDADFPSIAALLPQQHTTMASVEVAPLLEAIERVTVMADSNSQVRMEFKDDTVTLTAGNGNQGSAREQLDCELIGESVVTAFNSPYLKDGLRTFSHDKVIFGLTGQYRPVLLVPGGQPLPEADAEGNFPSPVTDYLYLLMPVRLPG